MSKKPNKLVGSYFVRVRKTMWNLWYQHYKDGDRAQDKVPLLAYKDLGFRVDMSALEAKVRCKQLNSERAIDKEKIRLSAERVTEFKIIDKILFPVADVEAFMQLLDDENFGSDVHLSKLYSQFNFVQKMVVDLKLTNPSVYKTESKRIYKHLMDQKLSLNYSNRIISTLNRWGKFISKQQGRYYEDVPKPKGRERSAIAEAQRTKRGKDSERGVRIESDPLTPENLEKIAINFSTEQYNWLYLTVWLGLRPEEADEVQKIKVKYDERLKVYVVSVYQSKLMSVAESERWKHIPIVFKEQKKCLEIIESQAVKRPLSKTIRKYAGDKITNYGGRKNFVDLCLDRDQNFVDIAAWMGHKDTNTTYKHYKQRNMVRFTKPSAPKRKLKIV